MVVGRHGRRLTDEVRGDSVPSQYVLAALDARGVLIFDDHVRRTKATEEPFPGVGEVDRVKRAIASGARHAVADTLPELVDEVASLGDRRGGSCGALSMLTLPRWVQAQRPMRTGSQSGQCDAGPQTAPFYALEVRPVITFGGIAMSLDGEVLDHAGQPVPGLFAGGADIGGVSYTALQAVWRRASSPGCGLGDQQREPRLLQEPLLLDDGGSVRVSAGR